MRIGYPCIPLSINARTTRKVTLNSFSIDNFYKCTLENLKDLLKILKFNKENHIDFFRISSDIIPFGSHEINKIEWWQDFKDELDVIGKYIKKNNMRVSMHPGQYTVLNSPNESTVTKSINDLIYHCKFLDSLDINFEHKIIIHIGGIYDSKDDATKRFISNFNKLPSNVKNRLIIENDEKNYSLDDVLSISNKINIPVVFDNLHNKCYDDNDYSLYDILNMVNNTWKTQDGNMKVHYSEQDKHRKIGSHCYSLEVNPFLNYLKEAEKFDMDIMLEIKDKDFAAIKANNIIRENSNIITLSDKEKEFERYKLFLLEKQDKLCDKAKFINSPLIDFYKELDLLYDSTTSDASFNKALIKGFIDIEEKLSSREINHFYKYKENKDFEKAKLYLLKLANKYNIPNLISSYFFYSN